MGAREIEFDQTAVLRVGALSRVGYIRTRKTDPERHLLRNGGSIAPSGKAANPAAASSERPVLWRRAAAADSRCCEDRSR